MLNKRYWIKTLCGYSTHIYGVPTHTHTHWHRDLQCIIHLAASVFIIWFCCYGNISKAPRGQRRGEREKWCEGDRGKKRERNTETKKIVSSTESLFSSGRNHTRTYTAKNIDQLLCLIISSKPLKISVSKAYLKWIHLSVKQYYIKLVWSIN